MAVDGTSGLSAKNLHGLEGPLGRRVGVVLRALAWAWPLLAVLLPFIFLFQYLFVDYQVSRTVDDELRRWADQVRAELRFTTKWELTSFRRSFLDVPNWTIRSRDGVIIDIDGFLPDVLPSAQPPISVYDTATNFQSAVGEGWRLLLRQVQGGVVILGVLASEDLATADLRLLASMPKFGSTLESAMHVPPREVDFIVQTAIVSDSGQLMSAWGGIPLKTAPLSASDYSDAFETRRVKGKGYRFFRFSVLSDAKSTEGIVVLHKDISGQDATLRQHAVASAILWLVAAIGSAAIIIRKQRSIRRPRLSVATAIRRGESDFVEFKASFQYDIVKKVKAEFLRKEAVDTVAAFLNSQRGGQLLIGVMDDGTIRGIEDDLRLTSKGSKDEFERLLTDTLADRIGRSFLRNWQISFETVSEKLVAVVDVEPSREPAFVAGDKGGYFIRAGNSSRLLEGKDMYNYLMKHRRWFV